MNLLYLHDRSQENITQLVSEFNAGQEFSQRIGTILTKAVNLYLLVHESQLCGFINFKYNADKKTFFCPVYLERHRSLFNPPEIARQTKQLFPEVQAEYCVFMNFLSDQSNNELWAGREPWDLSIGMRLEMKDLPAGHHKSCEVVCEREAIPVKQLLDLHLKAYGKEPQYVVGEWDALLEYFLTVPGNDIVTCRLNGTLIGACLGYPSGTDHYIYSLCLLPEYHGKGFGHILLCKYLALTANLSYRLDVLNSNLKAKKLYESMGFTKISENNAVYRLEL